MTNDAMKQNILDALHLLLELDCHLIDYEVGYTGKTDALKAMKQRFKEYGLYGREDYIHQMIREIKDNY